MNKRASTLVALAMLAFPGCDRGDAADTSQSAFLSRGNAICKDAKEDIARAARQMFDPTSRPEGSKLIRFGRQVAVPRLDQEVAALRRLPAPSGDEAEVNKMIESLKAALDRSRVKPLTFTPAKDSPYAKPDRLARSLGLTDCVSG
jgi:hypothetical protein